MRSPVHVKLELAVRGLRLAPHLKHDMLGSVVRSARDFASRELEILLPGDVVALCPVDTGPAKRSPYELRSEDDRFVIVRADGSADAEERIEISLFPTPFVLQPEHFGGHTDVASGNGSRGLPLYRSRFRLRAGIARNGLSVLHDDGQQNPDGAATTPSVDTSKPAIRGRVKTGQRKASGTGVSFTSSSALDASSGLGAHAVMVKPVRRPAARDHDFRHGPTPWVGPRSSFLSRL